MEQKRQTLKIISYIILAISVFSIVSMVWSLVTSSAAVDLMKAELAKAGITLDGGIVFTIFAVAVILGCSIGVFINLFLALKGLAVVKGKTVGGASTVIAIIFIVFGCLSIVSTLTGIGNNVGQGIYNLVVEVARTVMFVLYVSSMKALRGR